MAGTVSVVVMVMMKDESKFLEEEENVFFVTAQFLPSVISSPLLL